MPFNIPSADELAKDILILLAYLLIGAAIKYIDQAYDARKFSTRNALILAFPTALLMGYLIATDPYSTILFLAIILSSALAHKIDNEAFTLLATLAIISPLFFTTQIKIMWLPFTILFLAGLADEYGNQWSDDNLEPKNIKHKQQPTTKVAITFFQYRATTKLTILGLTIASITPITYLLALLLFDTGYETINNISKTQKPRKNKIYLK